MAFLLVLSLSTVFNAWIKLSVQVVCGFPAFLIDGAYALDNCFRSISPFIRILFQYSLSCDEVVDRGAVANPCSYLCNGYVAFHNFIYPNSKDSLNCRVMKGMFFFGCDQRGSRILIPRVECLVF